MYKVRERGGSGKEGEGGREGKEGGREGVRRRMKEAKREFELAGGRRREMK